MTIFDHLLNWLSQINKVLWVEKDLSVSDEAVHFVSGMKRKPLKPKLWSSTGRHWKRYETNITYDVHGFTDDWLPLISSARKWITCTSPSLSCRPASVVWRIILLCPSRCMTLWVCLCLFQNHHVLLLESDHQCIYNAKKTWKRTTQ